MAGHSKWANIKHRKSRSDAKKGKLFSQILKEIYSSVRQGGNDPKVNGRLRLALHRARAANIPNETIQRSLKRAETSQEEMHEVCYEVYGFGGVGIICSGSTENRNRSASFIRGAVSAKGGTMASPNSVLFNFSQKGVLTLPSQGVDFDALFFLVSEWGAEDVIEEGESIFVLVTPDRLGFFVDQLMGRQVTLSHFELSWIPNCEVVCSPEQEALNDKLIDALDAIDDLDQVVHNMKSSEAVPPSPLL
ncbi:YebC/PmpR family DNA-binding transcriptional regulator [Candidatus Similichlamydia laticola]|uniref:Probable transcriptional regulatory protein HAT2_00617 n=1 Tax=Candidatus Similichlamydia laticola TaxID=2170265 RepID=A0A369K9K3_9BACT|nr:YebC/PmpR family DNA-binding transcriptional regulator [Candidatus Similichlamydia laticola]RDB31279.1 hypothetical protein HAT2_00617 [Candidatus Similichlamydia laticola]